MNENQEARTRKRRSSEEVKGLVVEFEASGLRCSEFCRDRGIVGGFDDRQSELIQVSARAGTGLGKAAM
jgi:hypothetical protein